ncbi:ABC transporter permease [Krasilnikoviella flava]|uniref:ABC-2 type transport system permease protein n=1 Tax=Krasilnikoviella flava TaxID=526729 RepID=A0A1T5KXZ5_9MICO|nr:ABC transporter permease [Krasilnikoviella flava]SKC68561.1 ABC-2 type transport system permease protein [Krasilnikoviella flava]
MSATTSTPGTTSGTTSGVTSAPAARPRIRTSTAVRAYLAVELRRSLRNRRTLIFSMVMPPVLFLIFGLQGDYANQSAGHGNVTAWIAVSMTLYGAMVTATAGGASVSVERAQGWTRQLRLTPLRPAVYVAVKLAAAMALGAASVLVTLVVAAVTGAQMPATAWVLCALLAWVGSLVFAAFGLFMGYLLPAENVMQILGPVLALLSFAGGLFVPLGDGWWATVAQLFPTYGLAELVHAPLGGELGITAVVNVVAWAVIFSVGAAWRFRKDTARV